MIKPIPNFPDYFADEDGNIFSLRQGNRLKKPTTYKKLKQCTVDVFYKKVQLRKDGKTYSRRVHSLILETFVSLRPKGMDACHGVLGKSNHSLKNLKWGTVKENMSDKYRDGTALFGEKNHRSTLTAEKVLDIRNKYSNGNITYNDLAEVYNVRPSTIGKIITRQRWTHI